MNPNETAPVFTRERILTFLLALLTLIALWLCYKIVEPFIPAVAFAVALAVATQRPYCALRSRFRGDTAAAAIAVVLVALLIIGPAAFLTTYIVQNAIDAVNALREGGGVAHMQEVLQAQPVIGPLVRQLTERVDITEQLQAVGQALAQRAGGFLSGSIGVLTQLGVTLFVLFFLFRDRGEAMRSVRAVLPLSMREADELFERVGSTIEATVNGSLTVALVQAVLAGTIYLILGVPGAVLWGAVTFLMALIPVLGTFLVWAPIALWLAFTGHVGKALFLAGWGGLVVGSIDNILYPYLVGNKLRLHTVPTFFSVLGGISLFGPAGLILGPMIVAVAIALVDVWFVRTEHGHAAESAISETAEISESPGTALKQGE